MNAIITIKTGKGERSNEKDIDKTVDELVKIIEYFKRRGYKEGLCRCFCDGTGIEMIK